MQDPNLQPPGYPSVSGQRVPDLNLAGVSTPQTDLSGGNFSDATPPQRLAVPPLSSSDPNGDIARLGIDPQVPYYELNLAGGALPVPRPAPVSPDAGAEGNAPTFGEPHFAVPAVKPFDLTAPGVDAIAPFAPDPQVDDLLQFARPIGLDIIAASDASLTPDMMAPDLDEYDRPDGLTIPSPLVDPALPDLQAPMLDQPVHMPDRPGDLAPDALGILRASATYRQLDDVPYHEVFMDRDGVNSARRRHFDLLMRGLEREEGQA